MSQSIIDYTAGRVHIPYSENQLWYHLKNNFYPALTDAAIGHIVADIHKLNIGDLFLDDCINKSDTTYATMLEDLHIDYTLID